VNQTTRYRYEKRIKQLESENSELRDKLYCFRSACMDVYDGCCDAIKSGSGLSISWVLRILKRGLQ